MTRPIKFRAWDFENEIMHYPKIQHDETFVLQLNCSYIGEFNGKKYESIKMNLMQFTGLTDRNGNEIYEGDIVKATEIESEGGGWKSELSVIGCVEYSLEWGYRFQLKTGQQRLINISSLKFRSLEVIGNIYQTPNLLKP